MRERCRILSAMRSPDFRAVWWKIERATQHRAAFHLDAEKYFGIEANRPLCIGKYNPSRSYYSFRVSYIPPTLREFLLYSAITIGDFAHDLRSALDHLAYQLALVEATRAGRRLDARDREGIYFPIHGRQRSAPKRRWTAKEKGYVSLFGASNTTRIKQFQPYRGRAGRTDYSAGRFRHQLTLLSRLSNRDKHRLPNVVAAFPADLRMIQPVRPGLQFEGIGFVSNRVVLGAEIFRARVSGAQDREVDVEAEVRPLIAFPNGANAGVEMDRIVLFVMEVVRAFDPDGKLPPLRR